MASTQQTSSDRDDEIDLGALLGTLVDHKWLIGVVTGAFLLVSVAYALLATPIYQANAIVQVEQKVPQLPGLSDLSQTLGASSSEATTEIALITSRSVIGKAVDDLHLDVVARPERFPVLGDFIARRYKPGRPGEVAPPRLGMNGYDWGGARLDVFQFDVPPDQLGLPYPLLTTEMAKGPAVARLRGAKGRPVAFVDDQPNNLISARTSVPDAHLFHLMADNSLRQFLPPLPEDIVAVEDWHDATPRIAAALLSHSMRPETRSQA